MQIRTNWIYKVDTRELRINEECKYVTCSADCKEWVSHQLKDSSILVKKTLKLMLNKVWSEKYQKLFHTILLHVIISKICFIPKMKAITFKHGTGNTSLLMLKSC